MKLLELNLKNFGRFRNRKIELADGLNIISGENESGKSTLHTFIRSMLFGMRRQRGRASRNDAYSRYEPWEGSVVYAGAVRFESGGKIFRLSRNFHKGQTSEELICETDGERLSVEDGDLSVLLGGVSAGIYDNTVSVGQLKSVTNDGLAAELKNYMASYQGSADGSLDLQAAADHLKAKRKELEGRIQSRQDARETEKKELYGRLEYVRQECRTLEENLQTAEAQLKEEIFHRDIPRQDVKKVLKESMEKSGRRWVRVTGISAAAAILVFLGVMRFLHVPSLLIRVGLAVSILVLLGLVVFELTRRKKTVLLEEPDETSRMIQKLQWNVEYLRQEVQGKRMAAENLEQEYREYCLSCAEGDPLETDLEGVRLAMETIGKLSADMEKRVGAVLKQRMSEILTRITNGKYLSVSLDQELNMGLHTKEDYVPLNQVSRGTMEQVYFALRMAAAELLCAEEPLPVLLDEGFAMYDDRRLAEVLEWLAGQKRQVLLFTCQDREERILLQRRIPYRKVTLP